MPVLPFRYAAHFICSGRQKAPPSLRCSRLESAAKGVVLREEDRDRNLTGVEAALAYSAGPTGLVLRCQAEKSASSRPAELDASPSERIALELGEPLRGGAEEGSPQFRSIFFPDGESASQLAPKSVRPSPLVWPRLESPKKR